MANYGKYYIAIRLLLLKQHLEANAGRTRIVKRREPEVFTKLSFLDITIPHPLHLEKIQKGCGLCFLKSQLFNKLKCSID